MAIKKINIGGVEHELQTTIANIDNLQSSLDAKQATITGAATTITGSNLTASRALVSNSSGKVAVSDVTSTELGYLDGVTSNLQTQLDSLQTTLGTKFNTVQAVKTSGADLNNYKTSGIYHFSSSYSPTNIPDGNNGWLIVLSGSSDEVKQIWLRQGTANSNDWMTYIRLYYTSGGWSTWRRFLTTDEGVLKSGDTMTGTLQVPWLKIKNTNEYPVVSFYPSSVTDSCGGMGMDASTRKVRFTEYPTSMDGASTRYYEAYYLPAPSSSLTASKSYNILTSKSAVTIAQGGTGATTASAALTKLGAIGRSGTGTNAEIFNDYTNNVASGSYSHASGCSTSATGAYSHASGHGSTAVGNNAFAFGDYATASTHQTAVGYYNKITTAPSGTSDTTASAGVFVVGAGVSTTDRKNIFRVNPAGRPYALSTLSSSGADYAEYFEWIDGNPDDEDRRGRFVTLDGDKIRYATAEDDYVLGVVSAEPAVVGDIQSEQWRDRYLRDIFGSRIQETVEVEETVDENGVVTPAHTEKRWIPNPAYDPEEQYTSREERPEWDAVGIVGKLVVVDDGTCQVNGYCYPDVDGIATATDSKTAYRIIERLDDTHVKIFIK